jgi:hypothetical protein
MEQDQQQHVIELLEVWRSVTASIVAALHDPDSLDRWYTLSKADAARWSPVARSSVARAVLDGEFIGLRFNAEWAEEQLDQARKIAYEIEHPELLLRDPDEVENDSSE